MSGARDYGVGLVCRYENAKNYYLLSVLSGGRYNIVRYRRGTPTSLTRGIQSHGGGDETVNQIAAKCVGRDPASLTLTLNGRELATVKDASGIGRGSVGLRLGTSESVVPCKFEDFALRFL